MEKKLRTKFTILSVAAFFIVLLLISTALIYANYSRVTSQADSTINKIINNGGYFGPPEVDSDEDDDDDKPSREDMTSDERADAEEPFFSRYFTVKFSKNKEIREIDTSHIYSVSSDEAGSYSKKVLNEIGSSSEKSGFLYNYRYKIKRSGEEYICVFLDYSRDIRLLNSFIKNNVLIAVISLICISLISWFLSKRAVSPLVLSYEKQKQFITNASHELKTPLAIINANNDIIEIEAGKSKWVEGNRSQIKKLSDMIDMLVTLTKLDELASPENVETVDISALLHLSVENFSSLAKSHGKSFSISVPEPVISKVNKDEIKKLLSILLENSIKYSAEKSVISLRLAALGRDEKSKDSQSGETLRHFAFSIENISENLHKGSYDELLDRFYRPDASRNSETGGFGIGLSIAKAIVEKHGGSIKASSPDGERMVVSVEI